MTGILNKYKSDKDVSKFTNYYDTSCHYFIEREGRVLSNRGLHNDPNSVLIDSANFYTREQIDTLHDYCLFFNEKGEWWKEQAERLLSELREMGVKAPKWEDIYFVDEDVARLVVGWSVEVGNREIAPVESEIVKHVIGRRGAITTKLVAAVYDEVPEGEEGSPSIQRKRTGYITSGRRKLGKFEVQS